MATITTRRSGIQGLFQGAYVPLYILWHHANQRAVVSNFLTAFALSSFFLARFYFPWAVIGITALSFGYWVSHKSPGPILAYLAIATVPVAWIFGAVGSDLWGFGYWDASVTLMIWWATMVAVYTMQHRAAVFTWLIPVALIHAMATLYQGMITHVIRPNVLADSPNVSGGFLAIMSVWLLSGPYKILAFPLVWAMAFTGSRWAAAVFGMVLLAMMLQKTVQWRLGALLMASTIIISLPFATEVTKAFRVYPLFDPPASITEDIERHLSKVKTDMDSRTSWVPHETQAAHEEFKWGTSARWLGLAPMGFMGSNDVHSVGIRMIYEVGIIPMAIWSLVSGFALWVKPRFTASWWALLAFLGLTVLDYYAWMPFTISAMWFVLLAIRLKPSGPVMANEGTGVDEDSAGHDSP